jgi:hypothetical protein
MLYKYSYIAQYCILGLKNAEEFSFQYTKILVMKKKISTVFTTVFFRLLKFSAFLIMTKCFSLPQMKVQLVRPKHRWDSNVNV